MDQSKARADDEKLLSWIAMRCAGFSAGQIASREGVRSSAAIRVATKRVLDADIAHSSQDESKIRAEYW